MKTIKQFIVAILTLACLTAAQAQSNFGEFRWGPKAGVNFASVSNLSESVEKDKGRLGFVAGAFCKIPLKHYVSIRPELLFHMKGVTLNIPTDVVGETDKGRFALSYLEVPLSVDFDLPFFLDFHAGIQGAWLLSKKIEINGSEIQDNDRFNDIELGWHAGCGIDLGNIGVHVRFQQSLTPYYDAAFSGTGRLEPHNWGISLTGAYMLVNY